MPNDGRLRDDDDDDDEKITRDRLQTDVGFGTLVRRWDQDVCIQGVFFFIKAGLKSWRNTDYSVIILKIFFRKFFAHFIHF